MPKSRSKSKSRKPASTAMAAGANAFLPKAVKHPGADAGRGLQRAVKPMPLPGKSRGR